VGGVGFLLLGESLGVRKTVDASPILVTDNTINIGAEHRSLLVEFQGSSTAGQEVILDVKDPGVTGKRTDSW